MAITCHLENGKLWYPGNHLAYFDEFWHIDASGTYTTRQPL